MMSLSLRLTSSASPPASVYPFRTAEARDAVSPSRLGLDWIAKHFMGF